MASQFSVGLLSKTLLGGEKKPTKSSNDELLNIFSSAEEKSRKAWEEIKAAPLNPLLRFGTSKGKEADDEEDDEEDEEEEEEEEGKRSTGKRRRTRDEDSDSDADSFDDISDRDDDDDFLRDEDLEDRSDDENAVSEDDSETEDFNVYRDEPEMADLASRGVDEEEEGEDEDEEDEDAETKKDEDGNKEPQKKTKKERRDEKKQEHKHEKELLKGIKAEERLSKAEEEKEKLTRTIFIGNLPISVKKKELKRIIKPLIAGDDKRPAGKIESVRFRSIAFSKPHTPRKFAYSEESFHPMRDSMNAYMVLDSLQTAKRACRADNLEVQGKHIRVDMADNTNHRDRNTVFVGALPFDVEDEEVRKIFESFGAVKSVRLIRDKATNLGKGIGYITFQSYDGFHRVLKAEKVVMKDRKLRVQKVKASGSKKEIHRAEKERKQSGIPARLQQGAQVFAPKKDKSRWRDRGKTRDGEEEEEDNRKRWEGQRAAEGQVPRLKPKRADPNKNPHNKKKKKKKEDDKKKQEKQAKKMEKRKEKRQQFELASSRGGRGGGGRGGRGGGRGGGGGRPPHKRQRNT